jgi:hypothetical protein
VAYLSQIIWIDSACSDLYVSFLKTIMLNKEFSPGDEPTDYTASWVEVSENPVFEN